MALTAEQRKTLLRSFNGWLCLGFGTGLFPWAPGSFASLIALGFYFGLTWVNPWIIHVLLPALFFLGMKACDRVLVNTSMHDPGEIVVDEWVGQWLTVLLIVDVLAVTAHWFYPLPDWGICLSAFVAFRWFDIRKPWPVSWADRQLHGGFGIMLDDVFAAIQAALTVLGILWVLKWALR
jgi:phosphatidylglycerophosphatase A